MKKFLLSLMLVFASILHVAAFTQSDVQWWVNSTTAPGNDKAVMFIYYPDLGACFAWGYKFDAGQTLVVGDMMSDIEEADSNLTFNGVSAGFLNEAEYIYNGTTYSGFATDGSSNYWMYNVNDVSANLGLASQPLSANDNVLWEYKTDWSSWNCTAVAAISNIVAVADPSPVVPARSYTTTFANAHWDFEDLTNVHATGTNANMFVPANWTTGTSIAAYMPYIYPNGSQSTLADKGYNSRHCLYLQNPSTASRVPVFAMMPAVTDKAYNQMQLEFYARTFNSQYDTQTSNTVYGDWKLGYLTSLADTLKANFTTNVHFLQDLSLTANWTKYTIDLTNVPDGAYMVAYATDAAHIRYMFMDDVQFAEKSATPQPTTYAISYSLTHYTGAAANPSSYTAGEDELEMTFTLETGYELDAITVTMGGVAISDLMLDYNADPYYYTTISGSNLTLNIGAMQAALAGDIAVTVTGKAALVGPTVIPGPATFEEYTMLAASGEKYCPWTADGTHYWQSGDYTFSCTRSYSGMMNDGFYAANYADTVYSSYADDYKAITCGAQEGTHYASLYYGGSWGGPCTVTCTERVISGTYVTLALNPYLCIHGRSWSAAFTDGDYLYLHVSGKKNGVYTGTSADFYLADYRNGKRIEVTDWQWFDLSGLGTVDELEFAIYDSQSGAGIGLYACFDNFGGTAPVAKHHGVASFEDITVDQNGVWQPTVDGDSLWWNGAYQFTSSCGYNGSYLYNVGVSAKADTTFVNDYTSGYDRKAAAGHAYEGNNYAVLYLSAYSGIAPVTMDEAAVVSGFAIDNNTYAVNSILNGDAYAKKFGKGDWFLLTVTGYLAGVQTGTVDFYLADFRDSVTYDWKYTRDWMWVDLTSLNTVDSLTFNLTSSDTGAWGMNTPAYFCMDNLGGQAPAVLPDYQHIVGQSGTPTALDALRGEDKAEKFILDGQVVIRKNGHIYSTTGILIR